MNRDDFIWKRWRRYLGPTASPSRSRSEKKIAIRQFPHLGYCWNQSRLGSKHGSHFLCGSNSKTIALTGRATIQTQPIELGRPRCFRDYLHTQSQLSSEG